MSTGLGKGLSALLDDFDEKNQEKQKNYVKRVEMDKIKPNSGQPRKDFDEDRLNELAVSIKKHGVVQPIILKRNKNKYKIIAGERRWRAAKIAGLTEIPAIIKDISELEIMEIALVENIQREDLNCIEQANAYKQLIDEHKITQNELSEIIGKSRSNITNTLRLLKLPRIIIQYLLNEEISQGHARALLSLNNKDKMEKMALRIINEGLSVRQVEDAVKEESKDKKVNIKKKKEKPPEVLDLESRLTQFFETKVNIKNTKKGNKIIIDCPDDEQFERIIEKIDI